MSFKINKSPESEKKQLILSKGFVSGCLQNQEDNASIYQHPLVLYFKNFLHNSSDSMKMKGAYLKNLTAPPEKSQSPIHPVPPNPSLLPSVIIGFLPVVVQLTTRELTQQWEQIELCWVTEQSAQNAPFRQQETIRSVHGQSQKAITGKPGAGSIALRQICIKYCRSQLSGIYTQTPLQEDGLYI